MLTHGSTHKLAAIDLNDKNFPFKSAVFTMNPDTPPSPSLSPDMLSVTTRTPPTIAALAKEPVPSLLNPLWLLHPVPLVHIYGLTPFDPIAASGADTSSADGSPSPATATPLHSTAFAKALCEAFVTECGLPGLPTMPVDDDFQLSEEAVLPHWLPTNRRSSKQVTGASMPGGASVGSTSAGAQIASTVKARFPQDRVRFVFGNQDTLRQLPARSAPTAPTPLSPRSESGSLARTGLLTHHWIAKQVVQSPSFTLVFGSLDPSSGSMTGSSLALPPRTRSRTPSPSAGGAARRGSATTELLVEDDDPSSTSNTADASNVETLVRTVRNAVTMAGGGRVALCLVVPDVSDLDGDWVEERVSTLRRNLALDRKSVFVMASNANPQELAQNFTSAILDPALKHYAAKAAHLKKKRSRTAIPPSNAILSPIAWQVRYDTKLAVLAELRGEWIEALTHAQQAYSALVEHYMQRTDQVRVSDSASGLLVDAETLVGEEEQGALEVFGERWYEAKELADALVFKIAKLHVMMSKPALIQPLITNHLIDTLPILPDGPHAAPSTEWLVLDHRATFYAVVARLLIAQYASPASSSAANKQPATSWSRAHLIPHLGLPPAWFTRASETADAADAHAAQSVPGITLLPVLPHALLAKAQVRQSKLGLIYLAQAVHWATGSAVHAHWPRQVVAVGMALAKRAMDGGDSQVAVEVLDRVAEAVHGQQSGAGGGQQGGANWRRIKVAVLAELVAAASRAQLDSGSNAGKWAAAEVGARLQLVALSGVEEGQGRKDHLDKVLAVLSSQPAAADVPDGGEMPTDVVVSTSGLIALDAKFSGSLVSVHRPIYIKIRASPAAPGKKDVFAALMAKLAKVTIVFDDPAYNFELVHSPDAEASAVKKWSKQIPCTLSPASSATDDDDLEWKVELTIPEVTDLHIVSVDLALSPASSASPTVVLRLSVPPPSQSSLVTPSSFISSSGTGASNDTTSAPSSLASRPSAHLRVLPAYWDLDYAVQGPETLLVDEVMEATIVIEAKDKNEQAPRDLASPLIATVTTGQSLAMSTPPLTPAAAESAVSPPFGPAIELYPATDSGQADLAAGGAQVLAIPITKVPDRLPVFLRARHATSAPTSITIEIGDGPTSLSDSSSSATSPLVASPYPLSPSGIQLHAPGERTLSAILAPIPGTTPPPHPGRGSNEALTAVTGPAAISSKQAKHVFAVGRRWSATSGSVPRLTSRPTLSFATHPRTPFLASFSVSPARYRATPNDTFTEDRVLLVDFTASPHLAFELTSLETVPSASPATLSLVACPTPATLRPGDTWRVAVLVSSPVDSEPKLPLGALIVNWRRADGMDGMQGKDVETRVPLPVILRKPVTIVVETESARYATQYTPHPIDFVIHNVTSTVHRVSLTMEAGTVTIPSATPLSPPTMTEEPPAAPPATTTVAAQFAGDKITQLVLMPGQTHRVSIMAVPLVTGNVDLARCVVTTGEAGDEVNSPFARVFVMPEGNASDDGAVAV
ncbi:hypothetical protein BCR44DRAFT_84495 [Catenaria anguillulae PL171]|uniref:Trafficking protein particle complex subunit 11 domain-containing protein n=1 Tax=Catenaria anguillulae PL171 TaxID=765915 RepID=A0A1Y2HDC4_9FUNG|nr:hypothetical protein BCR44DRAFT_84495 [Catenaria anguillulae PL171]